MKFNYTELVNRIWEFNENRSLGLSTLAVYFYLLKIGFERGYNKFSVSDSQMSRELKMTRKTVKVCKEKLRHRDGVFVIIRKYYPRAKCANARFASAIL